jgi:hypothetical protein
MKHIGMTMEETVAFYGCGVRSMKEYENNKSLALEMEYSRMDRIRNDKK